MWVAAFFENTIPCTLTYSVAILIYNEGGLAAIPVVKNAIGSIGLACYCWGTTVILGMITGNLDDLYDLFIFCPYADMFQPRPGQ